MSTNINLNGIHQLNFDLDGTTTAALVAPGVTAITSRSNAITQLTGDVEAGPGYGPVTATVVGVNGAAVPASSAYIGTNSSKQVVTATTPLLPANNLSDVSSSTTARTNLGLGTMAVQNANAVAITGGTVDGVSAVGIGTASPQAPLHVAGSTNVMRFDNAGILNNPNLWIVQNAYFDGTWHRITSGSPVAGLNWTQSSGLLSFAADTSTTGTPVPATIATLSATGTFTAKNLALTSSGGGSLTFQDGTVQTTAATTHGTVTSVGVTVPSRQTVTGSPLTSSGTLAITDNNQSANQVFAGPSSGSAAAPTFRSLAAADLPVATTSALGAVKPDGTTITISGGVISSTGGGSSYSLGGSLSSSNVTLGPGAGTGATLVAVNGLDGTHSVKLTTGSSPDAYGIVWTLTFTTSRGHDTFPVIGPSNVITSTQQAVVPTTASATSYTVTAGSTPLAASTVYQWNVSCP